MTYETDNEMVADKFVALLGGEDVAEYWWDEDSETWVFDIGDVEDDSPLVAFANDNDMLEGGV